MKKRDLLSGYSEHECVLIKKHRSFFHYVWLLDDSRKRFCINVGKKLYDRVQEGEKLTVGRTGRKLIHIRVDHSDSASNRVTKTEYITEEIVKAHEYCFNNREQLKQKQKCGCLYCRSIFKSDEIEKYVADEPYGTAVCPYCGIDSVIGESSGYPIEPDFLKCMHEYWF